MSSLARRSLRTTAAAAGIAAIGVGLAGHAFAAPAVPADPGADALGLPAVPDTGALPEADVDALTEMLGGLPAAPSGDVAEVPDAFSFESPVVNTASTPALPAAPATPEALAGIVNADVDVDKLSAPDTQTDPASVMESNQPSALSMLDTAMMMAEMAEGVMAGGSPIEGTSVAGTPLG